MKYEVKFTAQFKREYKRSQKQGKDMDKLRAVVAILGDGEALPQRYQDHPLTGQWKGFRECHIQPDWLLIYRIDNGVLVLTLSRTGSHGELFGE